MNKDLLAKDWTIKMLSQTIEQLSMQINDTENVKERLEKRILTLEKQISEYENNLGEQKDQINSAQTAYLSLKKHAEKKLEKAAELYQTMKQKRDEAQSEIISVSNTKTNLEAENTNLHALLNQEKKRTNKQQNLKDEEIAKLSTKITNQEGLIDSLRKSLEESKNLISQKEDKILSFETSTNSTTEPPNTVELKSKLKANKAELQKMCAYNEELIGYVQELLAKKGDA